ncbi:MAG: VOC family protein [Paracoccaceae bacterium]
MEFYGHVANWTYQVERATDFVWGGGEKDFVLALSGDEAGAGLAETPPGQENGWIAYVEVPDVDAAVKRVDMLKGKIIREPFEVTGVGRNALVRDPFGALFGLSLSRHGFPVPRRQFGPEVYVSNGNDLPQAFYNELFGWQVSPERDMDSVVLLEPSGEPVAVEHVTKWPAGSNAAWVPSVKVASVFDACRAAEINGARPAFVYANETVQSHSRILFDPDGAPFALDVEWTNTF